MAALDAYVPEYLNDGVCPCCDDYFVDRCPKCSRCPVCHRDLKCKTEWP